MTNVIAGISGNLFPGRYLVERLAGGHFPSDDGWAHRRLQFARWWARAERSSGPASGLRAVFDVVAMPFFAMLGFRAGLARFEARHATAQLLTPGGRSVGLVLLPWAERPSALWREPCAIARAIGAAWCFLFAPPFLAIVDVRAHALRQSVELTLPDVLDASVFAVFWALAHATAFDAAANGVTGESRLDVLVRAAAVFQDRVRDDLQHGVAEALVEFGRALGPRPPVLAPRASGVASRFDEALTLVYRVLFLLFAESRGLVPYGVPVYRDAYTVGALCRQALADRDAPGVWDGLAAITRLLRVGCRTSDLRVKPFNGRLFARASAPTLERVRAPRRTPAAAARDQAAARALAALGSRATRHGRETIAYGDLGVEQLGAVYERVLDIDPEALDAAPMDEPGAAARDALRRRRAPSQHSTRRKTTGTFYTPQPLADFVARRTLAPLVAGAAPDTILGLRVVDPAMGSGAFLVAACRYLAGAYERALIEHGHAAPADFDADARAGVRRLVAERCLVGVDRNPVAVQVARLSMWLATLARGRPLGFLDHRLRVGDSLVGASPDDLRRITASAARGRGVLPLFDDVLLDHAMHAAARPLAALHDRREDSVDDVRAKEAIWADLTSASSPLEPWRRAADLWCARWFWPDDDVPPSPAELRALMDAILRRDRTLAEAYVNDRLAVARAVAAARRFFHWPIEMSDVFYGDDGLPRGRAGFDAVLANPPWEMLRGDASDDNGDARRSARDDAASAGDRRRALRFIRESGIYASCGRGHLNLYQPFLERALSLAREGGRVGLVVPWSLATDDGAAALRRRLLERCTLHTVVGLDNANGLFPIHRGLRFMAIVASPGGATGEIRARFGVKTAAEIETLPDREDGLAPTAYPVRLHRRQVEAVSGPAMRIPDVRHAHEFRLAERLCREFPALGDAAGWHASFGRELNATEDRGSFGSTGLPVIQGRHLAPFRVDTAAPDARIAPDAARRLLPGAPFERRRLGYRDVSGVGNRLSLIAAIVPAGVVTTHTIFCLRARTDAAAAADVSLDFLCGLLNSYVLNGIVRLLMGSHVTTSLVERLPAPAWTGDAAQRRVAQAARTLSLAWSARTHARLQADVAAIFGLDAAEFEHVVGGFPLVDADDRALAVRMHAQMVRRQPGHGSAAS